MRIGCLAGLLSRHLGNCRQDCCFLTSGRAASTPRLVEAEFVKVVCCDLFAGSDLSEGVNEDPLFRNDHVRVRLARMIDGLGAGAAPASVNGPFSINITDALFTRCAPSALSFNQ